MMLLILDTDHLTVIQRQTEPGFANLRNRLQACAPGEVHTTIVNIEEQMRGWLQLIAGVKNNQPEVAAYQRLQAMLSFFNQIPAFAYDRDAAEQFARLRGARVRIGTMDLKIASIALTRQALLLSRNLADFQQVPGLQVADWTT